MVAKKKAQRDALVAPTKEQQVLDALLNQVSDTRKPGLEKFAQLQQRRAERMTGTGKRLEKVLGKQNPRVIALDRAASSAGQLHIQANVAAKREARKLRVKANEWAVFGEVMDVKGRPVAGLQVQLIDKHRRINQKLAASETDEFGDFFLLLPIKGILPDLENSIGKRMALELYLHIFDKKGTELFPSKNALTPQAGHAEYFKVTLTDTSPRQKRAVKQGHRIKNDLKTRP